jgi:hypothetical protein
MTSTGAVAFTGFQLMRMAFDSPRWASFMAEALPPRVHIVADQSITHRRKSSGVTFPPHRTVETCVPS